MITRFKYLYKLVLLFIFLFYSNAFTSNLIIDGLSKLNFDDLQALTNVDIEKSSFNDNDVNKIIFDLYKSDLIFDLKLTKKDNNFYLFIQENKLIQNIYINGNTRIRDTLILDNINQKSNTYINKDKIKQDVNLIKVLYSSKGFNDVDVVTSTEMFSEDRVNLIYEINEGVASNISMIKFIGNDSYSDRYLSSLINSKSLSFYNVFSSGSNLNSDNFLFDVNKLNSYYKSKGFFDVSVYYDISTSSFNSYILTYYINEGNRIKLDDVYFSDINKTYDQSIYDLKDKFVKNLEKNKNFYDKSSIDKFLASLNKYLIKNNNYSYIFQADLINKDNIYSLNIFEKKVKPEVINSIVIYGNDITNDLTIRSKLSFQPGDYLNKNIIDISKKNLLSYKYVNDLEISTIPKEGGSDVIINIIENKKTGEILAAGTFSDDVGAGFEIGLKDNNLFGSGNKLDSRISLNNENTRFNVSFTQYPITTSKISNKYTIFNTQRDLQNSFGFNIEEQGVSYSINFEYDEMVDISTGLTYKKSDRNSPLKNTIAINDNIGKFDIYTIDLSVTYDSTNDSLYPTDGSLNSIFFEYSPKDISDEGYYKLILRSDTYSKFKNSNRFIFLSNDIGIADSLENNLKTKYAYSLGGLNFKGFDYRGIGPKSDDIYLGGNKFFTSTIGLGGSFLFDEKDNIRTKLFYSLGSLWDSDYSSQNKIDMRSSAGISFDFLTAIGPISFSYAIPLEKNNDDRTREFNFTIGTSF